MADKYHNEERNTITAIKQSNNPYEILQIMQIAPCSMYLRDAASKSMLKIFFDNDLHGNQKSKQVIHAVLNMMRLSRIEDRQKLGCHILWRICVETPYQKLPPKAFVEMIDEVEFVVTRSMRSYRLKCHQCVWLLHADSVLRNIEKIRIHFTPHRSQSF